MPVWFYLAQCSSYCGTYHSGEALGNIGVRGPVGATDTDLVELPAAGSMQRAAACCLRFMRACCQAPSQQWVRVSTCIACMQKYNFDGRIDGHAFRRTWDGLKSGAAIGSANVT